MQQICFQLIPTLWLLPIIRAAAAAAATSAPWIGCIEIGEMVWMWSSQGCENDWNLNHMLGVCRLLLSQIQCTCTHPIRMIRAISAWWSKYEPLITASVGVHCDRFFHSFASHSHMRSMKSFVAHFMYICHTINGTKAHPFRSFSVSMQWYARMCVYMYICPIVPVCWPPSI